MSHIKWFAGTYYSLHFLAFFTFYIFGILFLVSVFSDLVFNKSRMGDDDLIVLIFTVCALIIHYFINRRHFVFHKAIITIVGCALGFSVSLFYLISNLLNLQLQTRFDEPYRLLDSETSTIYIALLEIFLIPLLITFLLYTLFQKLFGKSEKALEWAFGLSILVVIAFVGIGNEFHQQLLQTYKDPLIQFSNYFLGVPLMGFANILFRKSDKNPLLYK